MIGPLFVAAGVSAFDLLVGLFVGNLLAVLSWTFLTAPIATRARLTLYYQLEKICGRRLVTLYNLANGLMFCLLAGSMITVVGHRGRRVVQFCDAGSSPTRYPTGSAGSSRCSRRGRGHRRRG